MSFRINSDTAMPTFAGGRTIPKEYLPRFAGERKWWHFNNIGKTLEKLIEEAAKKGQDMEVEVSKARTFFKMLMGRSPGGSSNPVPQAVFT